MHEQLWYFCINAGLSGTFSNYLIPLQISARDMASGFLNMLSYWFSFIKYCNVYINLRGRWSASGGWTIYPL